MLSKEETAKRSHRRPGESRRSIILVAMATAAAARKGPRQDTPIDVNLTGVGLIRAGGELKMVGGQRSSRNL